MYKSLDNTGSMEGTSRAKSIVSKKVKSYPRDEIMNNEDKLFLHSIKEEEDPIEAAASPRIKSL